MQVLGTHPAAPRETVRGLEWVTTFASVTRHVELMGHAVQTLTLHALPVWVCQVNYR